MCLVLLFQDSTSVHVVRSGIKKKKDRLCMYDVIVRRVRLTIVGAEEQ